MKTYSVNNTAGSTAEPGPENEPKAAHAPKLTTAAPMPSSTAPMPSSAAPMPSSTAPMPSSAAPELPQLAIDYIYAQTCNYTKLRDIKRIGGGSQARVYSALYEGTPIAAKEFRKPDDFKDEVIPMTCFRSPYTEPVLGIDREHCTLLMPLRKCTLKDLYHDPKTLPPFPWQTILNVTLALSHIHACGYAHRDIKLANVLIDRNGFATLADYGLSWKLANRNFELGAGSPICMAPELFRDNKDVDLIKADIYSLGILMLEVAISHISFESLFPTNWNELIDRTRKGEMLKDIFQAVAKLNTKPNMQAVCKLITACIDMDPSKRPSTKEVIAIITKQGINIPVYVARPLAPPPQEELFYWVEARLQTFGFNHKPIAPANTDITTLSDTTIIKNACKFFVEGWHASSTFFYRGYIKRKVERAISCNDKEKQIPSIIDEYVFGLGK